MEKYKEIKKLGKGAQASCYLVHHLKVCTEIICWHSVNLSFILGFRKRRTMYWKRLNVRMKMLQERLFRRLWHWGWVRQSSAKIISAVSWQVEFQLSARFHLERNTFYVMWLSRRTPESSELKHPNVCGYKEFFVNWDKSVSAMFVCIIMENYPNGDLSRSVAINRSLFDQLMPCADSTAIIWHIMSVN